MPNIVEVIIRGIDKTGTALKAPIRDLEDLSKVVGKIGPAFGITSAAAIAAMAGMVTSAASLGDEMAKASQKMGISVENLSRLKYAAELADVPFEDLQTALKKLSVSIAAGVTPTSDMGIAFQAMGMSVKDASGNVRPTEELFAELADRFAGMRDGAEKTALAVAIFGRAGQNILPMLNQGSAGLAKMAAESDRFGRTISGEQARRAEEFHDNLKRLKEQAGGLSMAFGNEVIPSLARLAEGLSGVIAKTVAATEAMRKMRERFYFGGAEKGAAGGAGGPWEEPKKTEAPNIEAIKKAQADRKKLEDDYSKHSLALLGERAVALQDFYGDAAELAKIAADEDIKGFEKRKKEAEDLDKSVRDMWAERSKAVGEALQAETDAAGYVAELLSPEQVLETGLAYGGVAEAIRLMNAGLADQIILEERAREAVASYAEMWRFAHTSEVEFATKLRDIWTNSWKGLEDQLAEFVVTGKAQFGDFFKYIAQELAKLAIHQVTAPLFAGLTGLLGFAAGGSVSSGRPIIVGERGAEIFVPSSAGTIIPHLGGSTAPHAAAGGPVTVIIQNQSGQPLAVKQSRTRFDAQGTIIDLVMDAINRDVHGAAGFFGKT